MLHTTVIKNGIVINIDKQNRQANRTGQDRTEQNRTEGKEKERERRGKKYRERGEKRRDWECEGNREETASLFRG